MTQKMTNNRRNKTWLQTGSHEDSNGKTQLRICCTPFSCRTSSANTQSKNTILTQMCTTWGAWVRIVRRTRRPKFRRLGSRVPGSLSTKSLLKPMSLLWTRRPHCPSTSCRRVRKWDLRGRIQTRCQLQFRSSNSKRSSKRMARRRLRHSATSSSRGARRPQ
jgi:hypothetical protein